MAPQLNRTGGATAPSIFVIPWRQETHSLELHQPKLQASIPVCT